MVDPIPSQAQWITQQALSAGLATLLKQGPQQGTVLSQQPGGKTVVSFSGKPYTMDVQGTNLRPGDAVLAKLVDGKLVLELATKSGDSASSQTSSVSVPMRSLGNVLSGMGLHQPQAQMIAQALLQAGIPLDKNTLKELAQLLPLLTGDQIPTLTFLLSRGVSINPAILAMMAHLFEKKPAISKTLNQVSTKLEELNQKLSREGDEGDSVLDASQRRRLREAQSQLQSMIPSLPQSGSAEQEKELEHFLRTILATPEALLQKNPAGFPQSLGETIVQLLMLLLELRSLFEASSYALLYRSLLHEIQLLHETLSAQAVQNLPPQNSDGFHPIFVQIPIDENGKKRQLDLRYTPRGKDKKSGNLDFRLDLTNLGALLVSIQWDHPRICISIVVSNSGIQEYIQPILNGLSENLQKKGFQVTSLGVVVGEIPDSLRPPQSDAVLPFTGVDFKV